MDFSGAKTISGIARAHRGSSVRAWAVSPPPAGSVPQGTPCGVAVPEERHPPFPGSNLPRPPLRAQGDGAGGTETPRGLRPRRPGQMAALDLLSHPATLGGPGPGCSSGKPSHDGTKANRDSGARGRATALAQHQPHRLRQGRMLLLPPAPIPPPPAHYI